MEKEKMKVDSGEKEDHDQGFNHGDHDDNQQQHHHRRINFIKKSDEKKTMSNKNLAGGSSNEIEFVAKAGNSSMEPESIASSSNRKDQVQVKKLESARAEMGEVREENQRLKMCLDRVMKDYRSLQMRFRNIVEQDGKKSTNDHDREVLEETELVSLTLGRFPSGRKRAPEMMSNTNYNQDGKDTNNDRQVLSPKQDLALGLDCTLSQLSKSSPNQSPSTNNCLELEAKEETAGETWPPSKVLKTMSSCGEDAEVYQQNPPKKARVCVRARCDTPTMNDGCQWRKYGQKIAKGNPCPRAYYRCTGAPSCPVRKQVQRCADDMSILIMTYEGTHSHPLPVSATGMASATSAASSMLLSGSSTSQGVPNIGDASSLQGLYYYLSDNSNSKQFYLPNSSIVSSSFPTNPTITLDLTSNPSSSSSLSSSTHFNKFPSSNYFNYPPRYPFTNLDFGSNPQSTNMLSWSNGLIGYNNRNPIATSTLQNSIYQSYLQKNSNANIHPPPPLQQPLPDNIAAATKAITADPSFQSALAAALTSIIGNSSGSSGSDGAVLGSTQGGGDGFGQKNKWGEPFSLSSSTYMNQGAAKGNACAPSFISKAQSSAANSQPGNLVFLAPNNSLPFSTSKSSSESPTDTRDQTS